MDLIQGLILEAEDNIAVLKHQNQKYEEKIEELEWSEKLLKKANNTLFDELDKETEKVQQLTATIENMQQGNNAIITIFNKLLAKSTKPKQIKPTKKALFEDAVVDDQEIQQLCLVNQKLKQFY